MGAADAPVQSLPLSPAQLGIWLGQQLDPLSPAYWTAEGIELSGRLDVAGFERVLREVLGACEALHMRFQVLGREVRQLPVLPRVCLRQLDVSASAEPLAAAQRWMQHDLQTTPDLEQGPLYAAALLKLGAGHHLFYLRVHHVALDGYGYSLLMSELARRYRAYVDGMAEELPPAAGDFAATLEEARIYCDTARAADSAFWREALRDAPAPARLAAPAPLSREQRHSPGSLPEAALADWQSAARRCGVDWSAWLVAATAAWLARSTGAAEVTLGLAVMNRLGSRALDVPCMAMNIVPLRLAVDPAQSMMRLAAWVSRALRAIRPHQRYRYEWIRDDLALERSPFGPVLNLMPFERELDFGGLEARHLPICAGPVEDLSITIAPDADRVRLDLDANPAAYAQGELDALRRAYAAALARLAEAPPDQALGRLLEGPALSVLQGDALPPSIDVLSAIQGHALIRPDAPALRQGEASLSYRQLLREVSALAGELAALGVGPETRVGLLAPREPATVIAMLAILWAGAAWVPLDPDSPDARIRLVLEDLRPPLVLVHSSHAGRIPAGFPLLRIDAWQRSIRVGELVPPCAVEPAALAYVIHTSGSTGRPNGVMISRAALSHYVVGARLRYAMHPEDRVLQFAPLHFDASVEEIFLALCSGACLVLRDDAMLESIPAFVDACARHGISVLDLPTAFWHELAHALGPTLALPASLRLTIIGGEAALAARVRQWRAWAPAHCQLLNTYGPTETTVICSTAVLAGEGQLEWEGDAVPIGHPLPGLTLVVVDAALRPLRRGEAGELCVIGAALARGYHEREALTAQRFVALADLPGSPRAYRTGDRVRLGAEGALIYLGRIDEEFKISGVRIDPAEVETALLEWPGLREVAVLGEIMPSGVRRLCAFIVADGVAPEAAALRAHLAQRLPPAAIPGVFLVIERLPRNANNKIDRKALLQRAAEAAAQAPSPLTDNAMLRRVIEVWREILGVADIGPHSDFFALGGKSLQAIQVANRLGLALQRDVPVSSLFRHPTVAALAEALDQPAGHLPPARQDPFAPLLCLQPGEGPALFCIHPAEGLSWAYLGLAAHLPQRPIYGLQSPAIQGQAASDIESLLEDYLARLRSVQAHGPYHFIGWSSGGGLAHALAARLQDAGETVGLLAMMDAYPADIWEGKAAPTERDALITLLDVIGDSAVDPDGQPLDAESMRRRLMRPGSSLAMAGAEGLDRLARMSVHSMLLYRQLRHPVYRGPLLYFLAAHRQPGAPDWRLWERYLDGKMDMIEIASTHNGMSRPLPLAQIGRALAARLEQA